ncbi:MAG: hypothetical protein WB786_03300 [Thermoplasmata archaeon]
MVNESEDKAKHTSIALSAVITAIWGGLWGFDWAASHMSEGLLFISIIIGLCFGTGLTYYVAKNAFDIIRKSGGEIRKE